ncbi:DUF4175 domain-containing protein [Maricaulis sp. CAU 1757]
MRRLTVPAAWLALVWERAVPVLWPGLAALSAHALLALLGVWERFGDPWRTIFVIAIAIAAAWMTWRNARRIAWPTREEATRRVEIDSGIGARPHEALEDQPSASDAGSLRLWQEHRRRMAERLERARTRRPHAAWARHDAWAIRGGVAVLLVTAFLLAGPAARNRLAEAFSPAPILAGGAPLSIDAWIDPPAYTGRAPVFLAETDDEARLPEGSLFVVRVAGTRRAPSLTLRDGGETERAEATEIGDSVWELRQEIRHDGTLHLASAGGRRNWQLNVIPDMPPRVRLLGVPDGTSSGNLHIRFTAEDDYGATGYALQLRPEDQPDADWDELPIEAALPVSADQDPDQIGGLSTLIETAQHQLAGSRVVIRLVAHDAAGNTGLSPELAITLPERVFLDALARAVAEQRRAVMSSWDEDYAPLPERPVLHAEDIPPGEPYFTADPARRIERAPEGLQQVARALVAVTDAPEYFFDDAAVYLGLREALHRLQRARERTALGGLDADLWDIALRAELGSLADAEAALRAAERALMEALARGADETELAALFEAFQEAMDNYMAAMAREAAEEGRFAEGGGGGADLNSEGLQEMLEALREEAELGNTANARMALQALSEMLRNMQIQLTQGGGEGGESDPVSEAMAEALEELGEIIGEQRNLQDQTFGLDQQQQGGEQPQSGEGQSQPGSGNQPQGLAENQSGAGQSTQSLADGQGQLAERFGEAQNQLPDGSGDTLGEAGQAMREAEEALRQGQTGDALDAQERALAQLRDGAEQLAQQLMERSENAQNQGEGQRDPLGRPSEGSFAEGAGVEVPEEMSRERAREILEELRRRAAEAGRPQEELDYIERLLDRF